jgi:hypothetical protein
VLAGLLLPTGWYEEIHRDQAWLKRVPLSGVTFLRLCLALDGLALLALGGLKRVEWPRFTPGHRLLLQPPDERDDLRRPLAWLAAATLLAAGLRFYRIGSDLWFDEITTTLYYQKISVLRILADYNSSNNHLLNTLAVKAMVALLGPAEKWIRLPAVLLGIAGVPALYFLSRLALTRRNAVLAAFLLAASYHHVFFSQNARGYTGFLLWATLGTAFFLRGLSADRTRDWVSYTLAMMLGAATVLYGFFVLAGHGFALLIIRWLRRGEAPLRPLLKKALAVWAFTGMLCFHLYAVVVPQVYAYLGEVYTTEAAGYAALSLEYLQELRRGLSAGFGGGAATVALLALGAMGPGLVSFWRRHPVFSLTLVSPLIVTTFFLLAFNLRVSPRFFLWGLPVAVVFAVGAAESLARTVRSRWRDRSAGAGVAASLVPVAMVAVVFGLSLFSLRHYYRTPKQSIRQSLTWLGAHKEPRELVGAVYLAEWPLRFYGPPVGLEEGRTFFIVRSVDQLEQLEQRSPDGRIWLVLTFPRALRLDFPELDRYIRDHYDVQETFPATIGDGEMSVWRSGLPGPMP